MSYSILNAIRLAMWGPPEPSGWVFRVAERQALLDVANAGLMAQLQEETRTRAGNREHEISIWGKRHLDAVRISSRPSNQPLNPLENP